MAESGRYKHARDTGTTIPASPTAHHFVCIISRFQAVRVLPDLLQTAWVRGMAVRENGIWLQVPSSLRYAAHSRVGGRSSRRSIAERETVASAS